MMNILLEKWSNALAYSHTFSLFEKSSENLVGDKGLGEEGVFVIWD